MSSNRPIGPDGKPMEGHHHARHEGPVDLYWQCVHQDLHRQEEQAVREIVLEDGLKYGRGYGPGSWTAKNIPVGDAFIIPKPTGPSSGNY